MVRPGRCAVSVLAVRSSPMRRRSFLAAAGVRKRRPPITFSSTTSGGDARLMPPPPPPVAAAPVLASFKNAGVVRKLISRCSELEEENARLRRRCQERGQRCKALRQEMRQQRDQARRLIVQCALKLDKSQRDIEKMKEMREEELASIGRQLLRADGALRTERRRLAVAAADKDKRIRALEAQIAAFKLQLSRPPPPQPQEARMLQESTRNSETIVSNEPAWSQRRPSPPTPASSLESSPERPPRFVIRPKNEVKPDDSDPDPFGLEALVLPPPLPPPPAAAAGHLSRRRCVARQQQTSLAEDASKSHWPALEGEKASRSQWPTRRRIKLAPLRGHLPNEAFAACSPMCTPEERLMLAKDLGRQRLLASSDEEDLSSVTSTVATTTDEGFISSQETANPSMATFNDSDHSGHSTSSSSTSGHSDVSDHSGHSAESRLSDPTRELRHNSLNHFLENHGLAHKSIVSPVAACSRGHRKATDVIRRGGAAYAAIFGKKSTSAPRLATLDEHEIALP